VFPWRRGKPRLAYGRERPKPWWVGFGRDLLLGAAVGAAVGAGFRDLAFGTACGAIVGLLMHLYFRLRTR